MSALDSPASMYVSPSLDRLGRWVGNHPKLWRALGNIETKLLSLDLQDINVIAPVYVSGLARSGSTILLEILASHPEAATHRYQDFPFLFTPFWWDRLMKLNRMRDTTHRERAHGDGIMVSPESPEAMEEMLWMAFFPGLHIPDHSHILDAATHNDAFEQFYRDHIRKLLLARKARRYVSKGNYNVARMAYLHKLFPDVRFILPMREPVSHVLSLMRQHARFSEAGRKDSRIATHMSLAGHFEFGLNRSPIHVGNTQRLHDIEQAWQNGEEARGWALYWDMIYRFIHEQLAGFESLRQNVMIVPFETLCDQPESIIRRLLQHAKLNESAALIDKWKNAIRKPAYGSSLSADDTKIIRDITGQTAALFGY